MADVAGTQKEFNDISGPQGPEEPLTAVWLIMAKVTQMM